MLKTTLIFWLVALAIGYVEGVMDVSVAKVILSILVISAVYVIYALTHFEKKERRELRKQQELRQSSD